MTITDMSIQNVNAPSQKIGTANFGHIHLVGQHIRKIVFLTGVATLSMFAFACNSTGYVASEPAYVKYVRPPQRNTEHVWIDGNWVYNNRTNMYVQKPGHWARPSHNRTYLKGYWHSSPKGKHWVPGHYQRNKR